MRLSLSCVKGSRRLSRRSLASLSKVLLKEVAMVKRRGSPPAWRRRRCLRACSRRSEAWKFCRPSCVKFTSINAGARPYALRSVTLGSTTRSESKRDAVLVSAATADSVRRQRLRRSHLPFAGRVELNRDRVLAAMHDLNLLYGVRADRENLRRRVGRRLAFLGFLLHDSTTITAIPKPASRTPANTIRPHFIMSTPLPPYAQTGRQDQQRNRQHARIERQPHLVRASW